MGIAEILALITGFFKFFPEIRKLIRVLSKTPEEKRSDVMEKIDADFEHLRKTGRPKWDV
jgi:hypothetical protein